VCLYIKIVFHVVICAHYCLPRYDMCLLCDSVIMKGKLKGKIHPIAGSQAERGNRFVALLFL
jgi:hypothetical protein